MLQGNQPSNTWRRPVRELCVQQLPRKAAYFIRWAWVEIKDLKTPLTRIIGDRYSVTNEVGRGTLPHTARTKMINPIRMVKKPVFPARRIVKMPTIPVY